MNNHHHSSYLCVLTPIRVKKEILCTITYLAFVSEFTIWPMVDPWDVEFLNCEPRLEER